MRLPKQNQPVRRNEERERQPHRVSLPGIKKNIGLGDVIKRVTNAVNITPCSGCEQRATALNGWVTFSPRN